MDILKLIKNRRTIRKYKDKPIPCKIINKIIEAGRWASSIHGYQPWEYVVVRNKNLISNIAKLLQTKSYSFGIVANVLLRSTANTIENSQTLIVVYNSEIFKRFAVKLQKNYTKFADIAELSAVAASIQNMILVAHALGVSSCWHDTPLFYEKEINKLLKTKASLVALLTLGYPAEKGKRSSRKDSAEAARFIK